jgi:hypothetical protein
MRYFIAAIVWGAFLTLFSGNALAASAASSLSADAPGLFEDTAQASAAEYNSHHHHHNNNNNNNDNNDNNDNNNGVPVVAAEPPSSGEAGLPSTEAGPLPSESPSGETAGEGGGDNNGGGNRNLPFTGLNLLALVLFGTALLGSGMLVRASSRLYLQR